MEKLYKFKSDYSVERYFFRNFAPKSKNNNKYTDNMAKKFAEHNGLNLTKTNNDVLAEWEKNDIFHKSIDEREGCPQFIFFEGPPSANGHPGIHHVLARSIKDTFNRYKTMKGLRYTARRDGILTDFLLNSVSRRNSALPRRILTTRLLRSISLQRTTTISVART